MRQAFLVLSSLLVASLAAAQSPLPRGVDNVLLVRLYEKTPAGIDALGRFGLVLSNKAVTQSMAVPAAGTRPAMTFTVSATHKGNGARATWQLVGASASAMAKGTTDVVEGALDRVSVQKDESGEMFASLEAGRASSFDVSALMLHFGAVPWGMTAPPGTAPMPMAPVAQVPGAYPAPVAPAPAPRALRGPSMDLQCPGGGAFALALDEGKGDCRTSFGADGEVSGAICDDGAGNAAEVDCRVAKAHGACVRTSGSGSCRERT